MVYLNPEERDSYLSERLVKEMSQKVSQLWVFVIEQGIGRENKKKIDLLYENLFEKEELNTFCQDAEEAKKFFEINNVQINVVTDPHNFRELCR